jgi:hypothetical protein
MLDGMLVDYLVTLLRMYQSIKIRTCFYTKMWLLQEAAAGHRRRRHATGRPCVPVVRILR